MTGHAMVVFFVLMNFSGTAPLLVVVLLIWAHTTQSTPIMAISAQDGTKLIHLLVYIFPEK